MSITLAGYDFEGPFKSSGSLENRAGVYAVFCPTSDNKYKVIDVGEASEVKSRVEQHDRSSCWGRNCSNLQYGAHYTPNTKQPGRRDIESKVRDKYDPPCGKQ